MVKENLTIKAYTLIKKRIVNSEFYPNMHLSEERLIRMLKIGRTPIREAVVRLKHEGFLRVIPRKGIFISSYSDSDIRQIYEMAEALEGMAVRLITEKITNKEMEKLERTVEGMEKAVENNDRRAWIRYDTEYHRLIHQMCHNRYISQAMVLITERIRRAGTLYLQLQGLPKRSTREHREVLEVMKRRDAKKARQLTEKHVERVTYDTIRIVKGLRVL